MITVTATQTVTDGLTQSEIDNVISELADDLNVPEEDVSLSVTYSATGVLTIDTINENVSTDVIEEEIEQALADSLGKLQSFHKILSPFTNIFY